jgi:hypothetical protein
MPDVRISVNERAAMRDLLTQWLGPTSPVRPEDYPPDVEISGDRVWPLATALNRCLDELERLTGSRRVPPDKRPPDIPDARGDQVKGTQLQRMLSALERCLDELDRLDTRSR